MGVGAAKAFLEKKQPGPIPYSSQEVSSPSPPPLQVCQPQGDGIWRLWQGIRWQNSVRLTIGVELPHTHLAKAENWSGFGAIWLILLCFLSSLVSCSFVRCLLTNLLRSDLGLPSWSTDFFLASY